MIKTKIISTPKGRLLVVGGMPEDAEHIHYVELHGNYLISYHWPIGSQYHEKVPSGNWQLMGKLSEVTEGQAEGIVETFDVGDGIPGYENYIETDRYTNTAKESLQSLIEANVPLRNKYGEKPDDSLYVHYGNHLYENDYKRWQAEEDKVFTNPILFWEQK